MLIKLRHQKLGQVPYAGLIFGITDIDYPAVANTTFVFYNPEKTLHTISDIRETSFLIAGINELNRCALNKISGLAVLWLVNCRCELT